MREGTERLVLLSESSIAIGVQQQPRRSQSDTNPSPIRTKEEEEEEEDSLASGENMKNSFRSLGLPKPNISIGIHRLFKGFKTFSQLFVYYKDEMEEEEVEMDLEIGSPTDVKHVTQIGLDSSASVATTDPTKGTWDDLI